MAYYKKVINEVLEVAKKSEAAEVRLRPKEYGDFGEYIEVYDRNGNEIATLCLFTNYNLNQSGLFEKYFERFLNTLESKLEELGYKYSGLDVDEVVYKRGG